MRRHYGVAGELAGFIEPHRSVVEDIGADATRNDVHTGALNSGIAIGLAFRTIAEDGVINVGSCFHESDARTD
jgi:hypothetical protein